MPTIFKHPLVITLASSFVLNGLLLKPVFAEPIYHPSGAKLTFGGMTHRQLTVSDMGNPAHPASVPYGAGNNSLYGAGLSIGLGIEYDGNDNLFKLLDDNGSDNALAPGDGSTSPGEGEDSDSTLETIIGKVVGAATPEQQAALQALVDEVSQKAIALGTTVAVSATGLNAKAFASANVPILISNDSIGAWAFEANYSLTTNLRGINDPIEFDSDVALQTLEDVYNLKSTDPVTTYDLGKSASLTVDPASGETTFLFENNSATITRAAAITEFSLGYSRKVWQQKDNAVYIGIKPKFLDVGLANNFIFIANIKNAKSIFDALDDSNFKHTQKLSADLGAIWRGKQYQVGATLTNINEPDFQFPEIDTSGISNPDIVNLIQSTQTYKMERQLKLEAGYISDSGAWGLNFGLDVNAIPDPMLDDYQWVSLGAGFASDNWWLPGARVGVRHNMAGTKLTYITGGVTVFNIVNIDLATTTDTVTIDGDTVPRGLILNIGAQVLF